MKYNIINACTDLGVSVDGADKGPIVINKYLNNNNINEVITIHKKSIHKSYDKNDLRKNEKWINTFNKRLFNIVRTCCKNGYIPITIGGDHSIAIGSALGSQSFHKNLGIIWVDAHADYNTFETTKTGNIHGLPLAAITGYKCKSLYTFFKGNNINPKNCVIVGARSIDPWEIGNLKDAGVTIYYMEDINKYGITKIMEDAINIANNGTNGIHISYDLDVIDPNDAPGVSIPEINGIKKEEAIKVMDVIIKHKDIVKSFDLVEYNPSRDKDYKTKDISVTLLDMFLNKNK